MKFEIVSFVKFFFLMTEQIFERENEIIFTHEHDLAK